MDGGASTSVRRADWRAFKAAGMPMDVVHRTVARETHAGVRAGIHQRPGEAAAICGIFAENTRKEKWRSEKGSSGVRESGFSGAVIGRASHFPSGATCCIVRRPKTA